MIYLVLTPAGIQRIAASDESQALLVAEALGHAYPSIVGTIERPSHTPPER